MAEGIQRDLSPTMLRHLAVGLEDAVEIAARFGIDEAAYRVLEQDDWFRAKVSSTLEELKESGEIFKIKARYYAEESSQTLFEATRVEGTKISDIQAATELFLKAADLMPKPNQQPAGGGNPGFGIKIIVNNVPVLTAGASEVHTIEGKAKAVDPLGAPPAQMRLVFAGNSDLTAGAEE